MPSALDPDPVFPDPPERLTPWAFIVDTVVRLEAVAVAGFCGVLVPNGSAGHRNCRTATACVLVVALVLVCSVLPLRAMKRNGGTSTSESRSPTNGAHPPSQLPSKGKPEDGNPAGRKRYAKTELHRSHCTPELVSDACALVHRMFMGVARLVSCRPPVCVSVPSLQHQHPGPLGPGLSVPHPMLDPRRAIPSTFGTPAKTV